MASPIEQRIHAEARANRKSTLWSGLKSAIGSLPGGLLGGLAIGGLLVGSVWLATAMTAGGFFTAASIAAANSSTFAAAGIGLTEKALGLLAVSTVFNAAFRAITKFSHGAQEAQVHNQRVTYVERTLTSDIERVQQLMTGTPEQAAARAAKFQFDGPERPVGGNIRQIVDQGPRSLDPRDYAARLAAERSQAGEKIH